jgi:hypothetical protein
VCGAPRLVTGIRRVAPGIERRSSMHAAAAPSALVTWLNNYGGIISFFVQMIYFIVIAAVATYAVILFKRLVDFKVGKPAKVKTEKSEDENETDVKVEEFVD